VNESIPRFGELVGKLVANRDCLSANFFTSSLIGVRERLPGLIRRQDSSSEIRKWSLSDKSRLSTASGNISIKAQVRKQLSLPKRTQESIVLRAGTYAEVLHDYEAAVAALLPILPNALVDRVFPGEHQTKFELLNGWQKPHPGKQYRTAYRRARWFLTRPASATALRFGVRGACRGGASLSILVGRVPTRQVVLGREWSDVSIPLTEIPPGSRFACELRATPRQHEPQFDDYRFAVRDRRFV
jgi:hypothetical protein